MIIALSFMCFGIGLLVGAVSGVFLVRRVYNQNTRRQLKINEAVNRLHK